MKEYRQIKNRPTKEEQEGMSNLLTRLREQREQATNRPLPESEEASKNLAGVAYTRPGVL